MANDIYSMGPASGVADALEQILSQRRQEKQQDIINQLNQQKADTESTHFQNEDAYNAAAKKSIEDTQAQALADRKANANNLANVSGYYSGQWSDDPIEQRINEAISLRPQDQPKLEEVLANHRLAKEQAAALQDQKKQGHSVWGRGNDGKLVYSGWVDDNDQVLPQEPKSPPQQHYGDLGPEEDEAGAPTGNRAILDQNTGDILKKPIRIGRKVPAPDKNIKDTTNLTPAEEAALAKFKSKTTVTPHWYGNTQPKPGDSDAYNTFLSAIVSRYPQDIQDTVADIQKNTPTMPTQDVIKRHAGVFKPDELLHLEKLLKLVRGESIPAGAQVPQ